MIRLLIITTCIALLAGCATTNEPATYSKEDFCDCLEYLKTKGVRVGEAVSMRVYESAYFPPALEPMLRQRKDPSAGIVPDNYRLIWGNDTYFLNAYPADDMIFYLLLKHSPGKKDIAQALASYIHDKLPRIVIHHKEWVPRGGCCLGPDWLACTSALKWTTYQLKSFDLVEKLVSDSKKGNISKRLELSPGEVLFRPNLQNAKLFKDYMYSHFFRSTDEKNAEREISFICAVEKVSKRLGDISREMIPEVNTLLEKKATPQRRAVAKKEIQDLLVKVKQLKSCLDMLKAVDLNVDDKAWNKQMQEYSKYFETLYPAEENKGKEEKR